MSLDLRLVAYAPNGPRLGVLPTPQTVQGSMPFGDVGAIEAAYPKAGPKASLLADPCEIAMEVSYDLGQSWTEPDNARYLRLVRKGDTVEQTPVVSYSGPAYLWTLTKARVLPEGLLNADGKRPFLTANVGTILRTLVQEAQARGALSGLDVSSFTTAKDSAGADWAQVITIYYEPGLDYLTILLNLAAQGLCDFTMSGRSLKVYNGDTVMAGASGAMLLKGRDLTEAPYTGTMEGLANFAYLQGDEGTSFTRTNAGGLAPWGRWETFISQGGVKDTGTMTVLTDSALELSAAERVENTYGLVFASAKALPFRDYGLGREVLVRDGEGLPASLRCRQITLTRDERGLVAGNVVLNDRFLENEVRQARRVQGITGGSTADGGSGARPAPEGPDTLAPKAPTGLAFASDSYLDDEGKVWATITTNWAPPTQNTNNTALTDLKGYDVFWRLAGDTTWTLGTTVDAPATGATLGGYYPNTAYEIAVKAYDEAGNRSPFSGTGNVTTDDDVTAPPKPSTPILSVLLGQVLVEWDGLGTGGVALPTDYARLEAHLSTVDGFAPSPATLFDQTTAPGVFSTVAAGLAYDTPVYVRFVMYDRSGNVSPASDQAVATPRRLVEMDLTGRMRESVQTVWADSFSTGEPLRWQRESGVGTASLIETVDSLSGDGILSATGGVAWLIPTMPMIPFDPALLYRMRVRYRSQAPISGTGRIYAGWVGFDKDGTYVSAGGLATLSNAHTHTAGYALPPADGSWATAEGFTQGYGSSAGTTSPAANPQLPGTMHPNVRYVLPLLILNYEGAATDVMQVDRIEIEQTRYPSNIIGRAQIADLAVDSAKINDMTADKITAGLLSAVVTISGRIATALTGARVELNSAGLKAYSASGALTVDIPSNGSGPTFTGTLSTGTTGARTTIAPNGSGALISLYSGMTSETAPGVIQTYLLGTGAAADAGILIRSPRKNNLDAAQIQLRSKDADTGADMIADVWNGQYYWASDPDYGGHHFTSADYATDWLTIGKSIGEYAAPGSAVITALNNLILTCPTNRAVKVVGIFDHSGGHLRMTNEYGQSRLSSGTDGSASPSYLASTVINNRTYASGPAVCITAAGAIGRITSLEASKVAIDRQWSSRDGVLEAVRRLTPATFYDRGNAERYAELVGTPEDERPEWVDADLPRRSLGVIAEDVQALGLEELLVYDDAGNLAGVQYERLAVALIPWLNALEARLATLESGA